MKSGSGTRRFLQLTLVAALVGLPAFGLYRWQLAHSTPQAKPAALPAGADVVQFAPNAAQLSSLRMAVVHDGPLPLSDAQNGRVSYDENRTTRISAPVNGRVTRVVAQLGDEVKPGSLLAAIDAPELAAAEADWQKAQADEVRKQRAFERARTLFDGEVLARKDFEAAEADFQQARAETRRAHLRLQNLHGNGQQAGQFALSTALGGVVVEKQINPGQEVRPDLPNPLFVISDISSVWVLVDVPERMTSLVHAGQAVQIETDAFADQAISARVEQIGATLDPVTRRFQVRCKVNNPEHKLKPEMFARVAFLADAGHAIAVPNASLFTEGMYSYVFVETRPGAFVKRRVNLKIKGQERSFVDAGLKDGEKIVTEGAFLLNAEVQVHAG